MNHWNPNDYPHAELTQRVIGCAIEVHRKLGPGLLESFYQRAMEIELQLAGLPFEREVPFRVSYKGYPVGEHRADFDIGKTLLLEIKAVDTVVPLHRAIAHSYLKVSKRPLILLMNFHEVLLKDGIHRLVLTGDYR